MNPKFEQIADMFCSIARAKPHDVAVIAPFGTDGAARRAYVQQTYRQIDEDSSRLAYGLVNLGIGRGSRAIVMMKSSIDYFSLFFALFRIGAVPVHIDVGMDLENAGRCVAEAEPEVFFGDTETFTASVLLGWAKDSLRLRVRVGKPHEISGLTLDELRASVPAGRSFEPAAMRPEEPAMIVYTSGSTGVAKGAVAPHSYISGIIQGLRHSYGTVANEGHMSPFPPFLMFNFGLGLKSVVPDMDAAQPAMVDPERIIRQVEDLGLQYMFATPAFMERLEQHATANSVVLTSLRRVLWAGSAVHPSALARFKRLTPNAEIVCVYSSTEATPIATIESGEILATARRTEMGGGICLGRTVPGMEVRIVTISDRPIARWDDDIEVAQGQIGEICVRGVTVSPSYLNRPDATQLAKIPDPRDGSFFHRMGDLGYFDEDGRLWFCGRKDHRVETRSETLYSAACEGAFDAHPDVRRSGLVGVQLSDGKIPVICVEPEPGADLKRLTAELLDMARSRAATRAIDTILFHSNLPVDTRHNSKIVREKLAIWASKRLQQLVA
ncbi:MAG: olefin beta-lactone synthetase [Bradyrhizobium sp.]|nr:olefin beta-lactone synthetase [Bradyrhizobium sp.]